MSSPEARYTGGDLLAQTLHDAGVTKIFALHGGHHEALFKGCIDQGIDLIDFRHEAAAGHAADAYARTTGKLGVCIITAGPGFTNAISAIANAQLDASPVLFLIGAPPLREVETNPLQGGIDQIAMARPAAKWALSIPSTERVRDLTAMAIRKAMTGRKGPVVLEIPIDILHMSVTGAQATPSAGLAVRPQPAPAPEEVAALAELLLRAERPVIVAGLESASAATAVALRALVAKLPLPVFAKPQAYGLLPAGHACDAGAAGNLAVLPIIGAGAPDLVILLGARLGLMLGGRSGALVPHDAHVVQIYSDASEIGRLRDIDLPIAADCAQTLTALTKALAAVDLPDTSAWTARAAGAKALAASAWPDAEVAGGIHPYHAAKAVANAAGQDAAYVFDGGESSSWGTATVAVDAPARVLSHGYLGCLGIGPGFAIGMQIAHPDRRVVQVTGDGAMGFHIQEFDTMVRHRLPIVTVILNNQVWGMSIHGQQMMYGANYNVITKLGSTQYASIAAAFGCHAERVTAFAEIAPAMARAFASGKPALVEIMTDADVVHPATVAMLGQLAEGSRDIMIPYYENIAAS
ncbi:thiamine pyrophosphate-binding protein [Polymorphobacter arshaanensis]|uniref:Thiamine pyrophosphate-binding protein n=1 Tax=Glacieibacterium arshaanense TaxID=2511025 RepID=A0A4Y9ENV7_9SPHN|nr:thiamine pyrophosphate-binding protein [Polymorphobacter arshaanensis]TFU03765.1 thiamine pyrophosphate-binding protein [Polymorphobacter arshaanensis]